MPSAAETAASSGWSCQREHLLLRGTTAAAAVCRIRRLRSFSQPLSSQNSRVGPNSRGVERRFPRSPSLTERAAEGAAEEKGAPAEAWEPERDSWLPMACEAMMSPSEAIVSPSDNIELDREAVF